MEPLNQKSQMDQEYGLLPADARQQKLICKEVLEEASPSHGQFMSTIFLRKKEKWFLQINFTSKGLNASIEYHYF